MLRRALAMPLRLRVTMLFIVLGLVMTSLFAAAVGWLTDDYEQVLIEEILRSQAQDYAARLRNEPDSILPRSSRLSGYVRRPDGSGLVPEALLALPPGIYESEREDEDDLHMAVFDTTVGRLYFNINLQDIERLDDHVDWILDVVILLGTLVSAWLGWMLSGSVVRPVRALADAVDALPAQPALTDLATSLPHDALGRLAKAIDDYQARLVANQDAERAFFADASHELRTPIAVVRGATELLIEDGADVPSMRPRLQRLDRGMRQLSELLDALLGLARRRVGALETVALRDWVESSLAAVDSVRDGNVQLVISGDNPRLALPLHEATLTLNGVVRQLAPAGTRGILQAVICSRQLQLQILPEHGHGSAADAEAPGGSDRGFGMTLVGRLATQIGWQIDEDLAHRRLNIHLPAVATQAAQT